MAASTAAVVEEVAHDKDISRVNEEHPSKRRKIEAAGSPPSTLARSVSEGPSNSDDDASSV